MINLDEHISEIKTDDCKRCNCVNATYDTNPKIEVIIHGSICYPNEGHANHIRMAAYDRNTGAPVWEKYCELGVLCEIPFTPVDTINPFRCD